MGFPWFAFLDAQRHTPLSLLASYSAACRRLPPRHNRKITPRAEHAAAL
jgi:hypothetical protein